jgi:hypothetical protein
VSGVAIPDSVTSIDSFTFYNCGSLTNIAIGKAVTNIGTLFANPPFFDCPNLIAITVSSRNPSYSSEDGVLFDKGQATLIQCPQAKPGSYAVPSTVTSISQGAFLGSGTLTSVTIPDSVTSIGEEAFSTCQSLTNVMIGNGATNLWPTIFFESTSLTGITVSSFNPYYTSLDGVLFDKSRTTLIAYPEGKAGSYTVPSSVTNIGAGAFSGCIGLTTVTIPDGVTSVEAGAFNDSSLTSASIPKSVISIGDYAFINCPSLTAITVDPLNAVYSSVAGVLFDKSQTTLIQCPGGKPGSYTVPSTVIRIADTAFWGCALLTTATIPNGVSAIGTQAFDYCYGLTNVAIGSGVTNIGAAAFDWCGNLTAIMVDPLNAVYSSLDGILFNRSQTTLTLCPEGKAGDYAVPTTVTNIAASAFVDCSKLTSVTIPASVTTIGDRAFEECGSLGAIFFRGNAPSLGGGVFASDDGATVYYLRGTTGWGATYGGRPTALWNPQVLTADDAFGVRSNLFGFTTAGPSDLVVVIEAATNLVNALWLPVATNRLRVGSAYFSDPNWSNYPTRFYRVRSL